MSKLEIDTAEVFEPLLAPARDKAAFGGRAGMKSHFFAGLLVEDCLAEPGDSGGAGMLAVCIREVQKDLKQSSKRLIEHKLREHGLGQAQGFRVYEDCIATPGDGIIIFKGMNDYTADSIKSLEGFKRGWWEEAHGATKTSIGLYRPTMRASGSQMWWSWNPRRKSDAVDVMLRGAELPTGARVVRTNWRDNPWITAELEQEREDCLRMTPDEYDHIWEGGYVKIFEGAYYAKQLNAAHNERRICKVTADPILRKRAIWDIGGAGKNADAMAIWVMQFAKREILVLDYIEGQSQVLSYYTGELRKRGHGDALCILPHDGVNTNSVTGKRFEDHLNDAEFETRVIKNQGQGAAMMRIEAGRRLFPIMYFDAVATEAGRDALGAYRPRKDDARGIDLGPLHDWASNGADAFGLAAVAYEQPKDKREEEPEREVWSIGFGDDGAGAGWMGN